MLLPPNNYAFTSAPHFPLFPIIIVTKCALKLTICNSSPSAVISPSFTKGNNFFVIYLCVFKSFCYFCPLKATSKEPPCQHLPSPCQSRYRLI